MNKYQKEIYKRAKLIKRKTGYPYRECKSIAKSRVLYDSIKLWD